MSTGWRCCRARQSVIEQTFRVPCEKPTAVVRPLQPTCGPITPGVPDSYSIRVRGRGLLSGHHRAHVRPEGHARDTSATVGADGTVRCAAHRAAAATGVNTRSWPGNVTHVAPCCAARACSPSRAWNQRWSWSRSPVPRARTTVVTGTDFPPGTTVTLSLGPGHHGGDAASRSRRMQSGAFAVSIFLLPHDIPGPRVLSAGTPGRPRGVPGRDRRLPRGGGTGQPPGRDPAITGLASIFRR